jgi:hypothetical protein
MTPAYRVLMDLDALASLPRSGNRRAKVLGMLAGLSENADLGGDFEINDPETSRPFQVSCVAGFAITWWIDHPVLEVKIIDIREAPRP